MQVHTQPMEDTPCQNKEMPNGMVQVVFTYEEWAWYLQKIKGQQQENGVSVLLSMFECNID